MKKKYWKPIDASGAALTLTYEQSGCYCIILEQVAHVFIDVTYPTTADTATAMIGGLPFKSKKGVGPVGTATILSTNTSLTLNFLTQPNSSNIKIAAQTGAIKTNAGLTATHFIGQFTCAVEDFGPMVFIGDSITNYWPLSSYISNSVNAGVASETSWDMLKRFNADVLAVNPSTVHILAGTNDIQQGLIAVDAIEAMGNMARKAGAKVLIGTIPPINAPTVIALELGKILVDDFNKNITAMASANGFTVIDYHNAMIFASGEQNTSLFGDGIHPSASGYGVMSALISPGSANNPLSLDVGNTATGNYVHLAGANSGQTPQITAKGVDTHVSLPISAKGTAGDVLVYTNNYGTLLAKFKSDGSVTIPGLAGAGTRAVTVDTAGKLMAP